MFLYHSKRLITRIGELPRINTPLTLLRILITRIVGEWQEAFTSAASK